MSERKQIQKEVSCKILQTNFLACKKRGIIIEEIIHNIPYDQKYLSIKYQRIEWENFLKIIDNMIKYFELDEFKSIARIHFAHAMYK